jgi:HD-like signal output (HDOD) protein/signal transduction histidine kinase
MYEPGSPPKSIIESVELVRLPSPPHILSKLLDICHNPDSSTNDLADIISFDAALTCKLIMAVNKATFATDQPVTSLEQAISLIDHDLVKSMVITSSIQQLFAGLLNSQKVFLYHAWLDSLYCAVFARDIAIALDYEHPQDAYLAGLLHDVGQIVFDAKYHDQYVKIFNAKTEAETIDQERSKFGVRHTDLGATILEQWSSLSPAIADAVRYHHEEAELLQGSDMLCQIVAEASNIARHWSRSGKADTKWQSALVSDSDLNKIYLHVQDKVAQTASKLGISLTRGKSLTQDHLSGEIEKETLRLARKIRDASLINVISAEETPFEILDSPNNLLLKIAREMQLYFSISDVALLFHDPDSTGYLTLYEVNLAQPASKFSVENNNSQISKSFNEKCKLWIEPESTETRKSPVSDQQIVRRLHHEIALSLPIMHEDEIIGTIVIGSHKTQKNNLEKLSNIISSYLENIAEIWLKSNPNSIRQTLANETRNEDAQRDINKLIHEISNPLSVIGNYIDIVRLKSEADGAASSKEIEILKEELQRIRNIVLNFKEGKETEPEPVFLNAELESCIPLYVKSTGSNSEVQTMWSLDRIDPEVNITRDALRQVILNLVKNAVEAQTEDAAIMVSSHHFVNIDGKAFAQFSISDRGKGIDKNTRELLFSPLSSKKEGEDRGLGLSVVAEILSRFDGQIKYMQNEARGALFEVSIPLSNEQ